MLSSTEAMVAVQGVHLKPVRLIPSSTAPLHLLKTSNLFDWAPSSLQTYKRCVIIIGDITLNIKKLFIANQCTH